jgi:hypothetical protein
MTLTRILSAVFMIFALALSAGCSSPNDTNSSGGNSSGSGSGGSRGGY